MTVVTRDGLDGGYKRQCCSLSLLRGEKILLIAPAISIVVPCTANTRAVTISVTGFVVLVR